MHSLGFDLNRGFVLAVERMEVRHAMLIVEHADHDSREARNLRHASSELLRHNAWDELQAKAARPLLFSLQRACRF